MDAVLPIPRGPQKRDLIELAFDDCGLAGYEFDRTPEEQSMALRKLNAMMGEWPWNQLGYRLPSYGNGLAEEFSGIAPSATNAVAQHLALRIAPGLANTLSPEQRATLAASRATLIAEVATIPDTLLPGNTPLGSGHRGYVRFTGAA